MIAVDTSFVASLFINDANHEAALLLHDGKNQFAITPLIRLEFRNALNQQILRRNLSELERDQLWSHFEDLIDQGVFVETTPATAALYEKARALSDRHTTTLATRSLDLLHVAAALLLKVDALYTFDERQKSAAVAENLTVFP